MISELSRQFYLNKLLNNYIFPWHGTEIHIAIPISTWGFVFFYEIIFLRFDIFSNFLATYTVVIEKVINGGTV